jgi:hypothetical protein
VVIFVGLITALGLLGNDDKKPPPAGTTASTRTQTTARPAANPPPAAPVARRVRLRIVATSDVYVCLKTGDKTLVDGQTLAAGDSTRTYRSKRFRLTLGNNGVRLLINGRSRGVAPSADPIGMQISPRGGRQPLAANKRPVCEP